VLAPALHGRRVHPESPRDLVHSRLAGHEREHGLLPLFHRATTGACSHVRVDGTGDLCLHGDLCDSLRSLLVLPSGTFHCRCSLTRSQGDFQFLEVSTSRWGTRYGATALLHSTSRRGDGATALLRSTSRRSGRSVDDRHAFATRQVLLLSPSPAGLVGARSPCAL